MIDYSSRSEFVRILSVNRANDAQIYGFHASDYFVIQGLLSAHDSVQHVPLLAGGAS